MLVLAGRGWYRNILLAALRGAEKRGLATLDDSRELLNVPELKASGILLPMTGDSVLQGAICRVNIIKHAAFYTFINNAFAETTCGPPRAHHRVTQLLERLCFVPVHRQDGSEQEAHDKGAEYAGTEGADGEEDDENEEGDEDGAEGGSAAGGRWGGADGWEFSLDAMHRRVAQNQKTQTRRHTRERLRGGRLRGGLGSGQGQPVEEEEEGVVMEEGEVVEEGEGEGAVSSRHRHGWKEFQSGHEVMALHPVSKMFQPGTVQGQPSSGVSGAGTSLPATTIAFEGEETPYSVFDRFVVPGPMTQLAARATMTYGGDGYCEHGKLREWCRECGGSGICQHHQRNGRCRECAAAAAMPPT